MINTMITCHNQNVTMSLAVTMQSNNKKNAVWFNSVPKIEQLGKNSEFSSANENVLP